MKRNKMDKYWKDVVTSLGSAPLLVGSALSGKLI
jgi:hypothetical protein